MNKEYSIDNFFIGQLYLSENIISRVERRTLKENDSYIKDWMKLTINGAIDFTHGYINRYINDETRRVYRPVLTCFYKVDNYYLCLHNSKTYPLDTYDFCEDLTPLKNFLPKLSYKIKESISVNEALRIFDCLFNTSVKRHFKYDKTLYNIEDFYTGNLNIYEGFFANSTEKDDYKNLPESLLLKKNGARIIDFNSITDSKLNCIGVPIGTHEYITYRTLFLKMQNGSMYNIHNNSFYEIGEMNGGNYKSTNIEECYYDEIYPFAQKLSENNIKYPSSITLPNSLKLYKKLKNNKM